MVESILCQVLTLISYSDGVGTANHHHSLMYLQHVLLHGLILLLVNFTQTPNHGVTVTDVAKCAINAASKSDTNISLLLGSEHVHLPG